MKKLILSAFALFIMAAIALVSCSKDPAPDSGASNLPGKLLTEARSELTLVSEESVNGESEVVKLSQESAGKADCFGKPVWDNSTSLTFSNGANAVVTPVKNDQGSVFLITVNEEGQAPVSFYLNTTLTSDNPDDKNFTIGMYTVNCELLHTTDFVKGEYAGGFNNIKNVPGISGTPLESIAERAYDRMGKIPCIGEALGCLMGIVSGGWIKPCLKLVICILNEIL